MWPPHLHGRVDFLLLPLDGSGGYPRGVWSRGAPTRRRSATTPRGGGRGALNVLVLLCLEAFIVVIDRAGVGPSAEEDGKGEGD